MGTGGSKHADRAAAAASEAAAAARQALETVQQQMEAARNNANQHMQQYQERQARDAESSRLSSYHFVPSFLVSEGCLANGFDQTPVSGGGDREAAEGRSGTPRPRSRRVNPAPAAIAGEMGFGPLERVLAGLWVVGVRSFFEFLWNSTNRRVALWDGDDQAWEMIFSRWPISVGQG